MYAVITTEEYRELIEAEQMCKEFRADFIQCSDELKEAREQLDKLLICITNGEKVSRWQDGKFEGFDLADKEEIAKYINTHFVYNGRLNIKENNDA